MEFDKEEYENLVDGRNELTDMIKDFIKKGYALNGGSTEMKLIIYLLIKNGSIRLYKNKRFLFWKRRMIEIYK